MTAVQEPKQAIGQRASHPRTKQAGAGQAGNERRERVVFRLSADEKQRAEYWAQKRGFSSVNEYVAEAVAEQIRRENLDYDLPTLEIARLTELIDHITTLSTNTANLERVITLGFDSLIGLTRGDNYLLDDEDGELS